MGGLCAFDSTLLTIVKSSLWPYCFAFFFFTV